jgi:hypothetical protein
VRRFVVVPLTAAELTTMFPIAHSLRPPTSSFEEVIESAWEMRVLPKLAARRVAELERECARLTQRLCEQREQCEALVAQTRTEQRLDAVSAASTFASSSSLANHCLVHGTSASADASGTAASAAAGYVMSYFGKH